MNVTIKRLLARAMVAGVALLPFAAQASGGGEIPLDSFPKSKLTDMPSLQNGAKLFVNYCLGCHSASSMRYNRLHDLGLNDEQIKANLLFTAPKVGDLMKISMDPVDAKKWFGARPPDLSVIARARGGAGGAGSDWLYTFLRAFYRDGSRETGWNNALFPNVGMPNVLWELQGRRSATIDEIKGSGDHGFKKITTVFAADGVRTEKTTEIKDGHPHEGRETRLGEPKGGKLSASDFDGAVGDLVAYLTYMSDPTAKQRSRLGVAVLIFLSIFMVAAWRLNQVFWKDIK